MFIIIGGDGKEYGPVTADQIRTWINAGRASLDTKAKALGSEEWRRLGDYAEFSLQTGSPPLIHSDLVSGGTAATSGLVAAERGTRLLARLIDWALELVCAIPGAMILGEEFLKVAIMVGRGEEPDFSELDYQRLGLGALVLGAGWLALLVVQVWMLTTRGQSIGKRITGIRIVRVEDGSKPGIVHAWVLREFLVTMIGIVAGLIPLVGPFLLRPAFHIVDWCLIFRDDQRCLHDLIASTRVVRT
ncbi:MAG: RDD family protein [Opitutaceae bacterium]